MKVKINVPHDDNWAQSFRAISEKIPALWAIKKAYTPMKKSAILSTNNVKDSITKFNYSLQKKPLIFKAEFL